jgi:hypothetical protein
MSTFDFGSPDGRTHSVTGPEGATKEQAWSILRRHLAGANSQRDAGDWWRKDPIDSSDRARPLLSDADVGLDHLSVEDVGLGKRTPASWGAIPLDQPKYDRRLSVDRRRRHDVDGRQDAALKMNAQKPKLFNAISNADAALVGRAVASANH